MKSDNPRSPDDDGQPQPQIVVDDPEDFAKTRQLRSIFDARDAYVDARRDANELQETGDIDFSAKNRRIFRHVQDFAMAVESLIRRHNADIWTEKTYRLSGWAKPRDVASLDTAVEHCQQHEPQLLAEYQEQRDGGYTAFDSTMTRIQNRIIWKATDTGVEFDGVQELISRTPRLKYLRTDHKKIGTSAPPQRLSDAVFRDVQQFIDDIGLGFAMEETQQTKIDADVLEELDQWRSQNI